MGEVGVVSCVRSVGGDPAVMLEDLARGLGGVREEWENRASGVMGNLGDKSGER